MNDEPFIGSGEGAGSVTGGEARPELLPPPPPLASPVRPRRRRWPLVVLLVVLLAAVTVMVARSVTLSYYRVSPGPVEDVTTYVSVPGDGNEVAGDLLFLTVLVEQVDALGYLDALFDPKVDLRPREVIRPPGVSQEELNEANAALMQDSIDRAIFVALTELGYDALLTGEGAVVLGIVEESPAVGLLRQGDIIVSIDDNPIRLAGDAVAEVGRARPGDRVVLTVMRVQEGVDDSSEIRIPVVLGVNPDDDARGFIGVFLDTHNVQAEYPVDVRIDARNIGGPSAGLMYTLEIMNLLTEGDLTKGRVIAGTGTIEFDGEIGSIGGIKQKVYAAIDAGAEYVLVPRGNYEDARRAAGDDIAVVPVDALTDALAFLNSLEPATVGAAAAGS